MKFYLSFTADLILFQLKYLPFENITYKTRLKEAEVIQRISDIVGSKRSIFEAFKQQKKPYEGSFRDNTFKISRVINYRNSFLPVISGTIQKEFDGTIIKVKMRLYPFVSVFAVIWLTGVLLAGAGMFLHGLLQSTFNWFSLVPLGMFVFGYGLTMGAFKYETRKSKEYFRELFDAAIL